MSSPKARMFKGFAKNSDTRNAAEIQIQGSSILFKVRPDKVPIKKEVRLTVMSVSKSLTVLIPAFKKLETVIPARIMVVLELSDAAASKKIARVVSSAPKKAKTGR